VVHDTSRECRDVRALGMRQCNGMGRYPARRAEIVVSETRSSETPAELASRVIA